MKWKLFKILLWCAIATPTWAQVPIYLDDTAPLEARVSDALSRMTTAEKTALLRAQSKFSSHGVPRLGIPELWWSDGPHGVRAEIQWDNWGYAHWTNDSITAFPALTCLAATWNPALAEAYGVALGEEARYRKKDVLLGPGVNIYRTPLNGRNFEYMGEDPKLAATMCAPYIRGVQRNGVAASLKHYALNNQEFERMEMDVQLSDRALHEIYLPAFKAGVEQGGAWTVMGSYNRIGGEYGCENERLLNQILKTDWGFNGVVVTDWGGCHSTYESAMHGLDVEMGSFTNGLTTESAFTWDDYYFGTAYNKLLAEGKIPMAVLDAQATRVLRLIFRTAMQRNRPWGSVATPEHYATAYRVGAEGVVLLQNRAVSKKAAPLLPIDTTQYRRILVVGDNATRDLCKGGGSSELKPRHLYTPLEALVATYGDRITYTQGYAAGAAYYSHIDEIPIQVMDSLRNQAVTMAREADLVLMVGGLNKNHLQDCEAADRESYELPFGQNELLDALLAVNPNVVLVLLSGNAVELPQVERIPAIVQGWYLGTMGGQVIADVLSGKVNPSGKLPFTFGKKLADYGAHAFGAESYPGIDHQQRYAEDILVGYRWFDTKRITPCFAFGHGLSYTTFHYGKATLSQKDITENECITIEIPITNSGNRAGSEVVQLYIGDPQCRVLRPVKELKAFQKIALDAGETATVRFTITAEDLKFYDETTAEWCAESGKFIAYIGSSSVDIRATLPFWLH